MIIRTTEKKQERGEGGREEGGAEKRTVHLSGARDHVLDVISVARAVDVGIMPLGRLVLHMRGVDGDFTIRERMRRLVSKRREGGRKGYAIWEENIELEKKKEGGREEGVRTAVALPGPCQSHRRSGTARHRPRLGPVNRNMNKWMSLYVCVCTPLEPPPSLAPSSFPPYLGDSGCEGGLAVVDVTDGANVQMGLCALKHCRQRSGCLRLGDCVEGGKREGGRKGGVSEKRKT
jgi:hypothetical protein